MVVSPVPTSADCCTLDRKKAPRNTVACLSTPCPTSSTMQWTDLPQISNDSAGMFLVRALEIDRSLEESGRCEC